MKSFTTARKKIITFLIVICLSTIGVITLNSCSEDKKTGLPQIYELFDLKNLDLTINIEDGEILILPRNSFNLPNDLSLKINNELVNLRIADYGDGDWEAVNDDYQFQPWGTYSFELIFNLKSK